MYSGATMSKQTAFLASARRRDELEALADQFLACHGRVSDFAPERAERKGRALARLQRGYRVFVDRSQATARPASGLEALDFEAAHSRLQEQTAEGLAFADPLEILEARETIQALADAELAAAMAPDVCDVASDDLAEALGITRRHAQRLQKQQREATNSGQGLLFA